MPNEIKTRDPQATLYHNDYLTWIVNIASWIVTQVGQPGYPTHLVAGIAALIDAFATALEDWHIKNGLAKGKNELFTTAYEQTFAQLQLLKESLPTVAPEPPVLSEFGILDALSGDRDDFFIQAKAAYDHWADVSAEPQFAPLVADFGIFVGFYDDFVLAKTAYYDMLNAAQQAQNLVLSTRAACHAKERPIFNWYRARHKKGDDEWWTGTWWGTTSGGGEEGGSGATFPDAPDGVKVTHNEMPSMNNLRWNKLNGAKTVNIGRAVTLIGEPEPSLTLWMTDVEGEAAIDPDAASGKSYYYQVTGVDAGNVEGKRSVVVKVDVA